MASRAEKAIRRKSDREEKRRKRRGEVPEVSPEEEEDMYLPDGSRNPKYYREESDQPIEPRDITRADTLADIDKQRELDEFHGLRPKPALGEFKDIAESGEFSDEEPQGTFEEEAVGEQTLEGVPVDEFEPRSTDMYERSSNSILSDTEAQMLVDDAYGEEGRGRPEGDMPGTSPARREQDAGADERKENKYQGDLAEYNSDEEVANRLEGDLNLDAEMEPLINKQQESGAELQAEHDAGTVDMVAGIDADRKPIPGGIIDTQVRKDAPHVEKLEGMIRDQGNRDAGVSRAEQAAADNPVWQAALEEKAAREAAEPSIHEKDTKASKEMAARYAARGTKGAYQRSAVEPPMKNSDGKELGSITYDPMLSEVRDIVVDGVTIDREVVDLEGVRDGENAKKKQEGMVWMIPSKGGFKTGDQRFAGEGPGRWMREDQALAADTTNSERQIEKARRQAILDKKNRTPTQMQEDNLREKRKHEIELKRIEHGKDDDDDDMDEEAKRELEVNRVDRILATPGLSSDDRNHWEAMRLYLLGGGAVGGAGAPVAPAGTVGVPAAAGGADAGADAAAGLNLMEPGDVSIDLSNQRPELEGEIDTLITDYIADSDGGVNLLNPADWFEVGTGLVGAEDNSSDVKNLAYLAKKLAALVTRGDINPRTLRAIRTKLIGTGGTGDERGMHPDVKKQLGESIGGSDEAEWILIQEFYADLMADPPRLPSSAGDVGNIPIGAWGH